MEQWCEKLLFKNHLGTSVTMLRNFKVLPLQSYARSTKVANTEFDDYNTNIDGDKLGEKAIHLTTKSFP